MGDRLERSAGSRAERDALDHRRPVAERVHLRPGQHHAHRPPQRARRQHRQHDVEIPRDLHGFLAATGLNRPGGVDIVAHDVGTWIGHAHAAIYPGDVKRLVLTESNVPGVTPPAPAGIPSEAINLKSWQFAFNRLDDLPEILVQGHERAYLAWLFATKTTRTYAIEPAAFEEYVRVFSTPGVARAGFAWYRANFSAEGLAQAKARAARRLSMPVLALGAVDGVGDALRAAVATVGDNVKGGAIGQGCGHFLPSECPDELTDAILAFWRATS